ncbi:hypothetical protein [Agrobacterium tumefaciens]|uniref:hypothetical protein n=1 Tax=Agrobacterium tumefaciens TaxID=358 RepID=UPI00164772CF|nr:hypothetical protein [Agrobacterium tumefaciens]
MIGKNLKAIDKRSGKRLVLRAFPNENKKLVHSQRLPQGHFPQAIKASLVSDFTKRPTVPGFLPLPFGGGKSRSEKNKKTSQKPLRFFSDPNTSRPPTRRT